MTDALRAWLTVAKARRAMGGFPAKPHNPARDPNNDPFMAFLFAQARAGVVFGDEAEARAAFARAAEQGQS